MTTKKLNRRDFLKLAASAGGGLVLALYLDSCSFPHLNLPPDTSTDPASQPGSLTPNLYVKIDSQGLLTVTAFRTEMGQGIRTALAMLAAEELDMAWENVRIEQATADRRYGDQRTGGSVSISTYYSGMRTAGATARQMLIEAAAKQWGVQAGDCATEPGFVIHPKGGKKLAYGDLVEAAAKLSPPLGVKTKDNGTFHILGTELGHWDAPQIVSGKAVYGLDVRIPGMLFAALARCPVFGGKYSSVNDAEALAIPGVKQIIQLDDRVAVVAENSWAAIRGRNALKITWDEGSNASLDSQEMLADAAARLKKTDKSNILEAVYEMPYEAHATMEPMNCTVHFHDGICEVWAPTQSAQDVQQAVARVSGLSQDKVTVYLPLVGGGFGRRLQTDYAEEAALVAKAVDAPVQVLWTRDDDLQHDYYHPLAVQYAFASLDKPGIPSIRVGNGSGVPTGAWRSVGEFTKAYPNECFIDELADKLGRDPLDLRREIYARNQRALGVINLAAEKAGWGAPMPAEQGRGMAYHATFGVTHVCQVAEVEVDSAGNVRVNRVVCAVDCGKVVNPGNVKAQMEGGIAFGLTAALKAEATLKNGRIQQSNFHDYPILRMDEMPLVETYIVESDERPTGIGEMGVPPIAPALANAVFAASGVRVRHIPIRPADLKV
jgi:isoquinoline 1-oxidoreductase beta subunit